MAFDPAPSSWITSWSEDGTDITFPIASIPNLSAALADAATGDWRLCICLIAEHTLNYFSSLAPADRPTQVTLASNLFVDSAGDIYKTISVTAKITAVMTGSMFTPDPE